MFAPGGDQTNFKSRKAYREPPRFIGAIGSLPLPASLAASSQLFWGQSS
jgi:hypothetical protein